MSQTKTTIYSIYTVEDQDYMLDFLGHITPLLEQYNASIWHDDIIPIGDQWKPQDNSRIPNTDLFLFFVSHNFMYSEFTNQIEFKQIIDSYKGGDCKVIPILIDDCPWDIDFKSEDYNFSFTELQVLPINQKPIVKWRNQKRAYKEIESEIKRVLANLSEKQKYEAKNHEERNLIINEKIERLEEETVNATIIADLERIEEEEIFASIIEEIAIVEANTVEEIDHEKELILPNINEKVEIIEDEVAIYKEDKTPVLKEKITYVEEVGAISSDKKAATIGKEENTIAEKEENTIIEEEVESFGIAEISSIIDEITAIIGEDNSAIVEAETSAIEEIKVNFNVVKGLTYFGNNESVFVSGGKISFGNERLVSKKTKKLKSVIANLDLTKEKEEVASIKEKSDPLDIEKKPGKSHKRISSEIKRILGIFKESNPVQNESKEDAVLDAEEPTTAVEENDISLISKEDNSPITAELVFDEEGEVVISSAEEKETSTTSLAENLVEDNIWTKDLDKDILSVDNEEYKYYSKEKNSIVIAEENTLIEEEQLAQILEEQIATVNEAKNTIIVKEEVAFLKEEENIISEETNIPIALEDNSIDSDEERIPFVAEVFSFAKEDSTVLEEEKNSTRVAAKKRRKSRALVTPDEVLLIKDEIMLIDDIEMAFIINEGIRSITREKNPPIINEDVALLDAQEFFPILDGEIQRIENEISLIKNIASKKRFNTYQAESKAEKKRYKGRSYGYWSKILIGIAISVYCIAAFVYFNDDLSKSGPMEALNNSMAVSESMLITDLNIGDGYDGGVIFEFDKTKQLGKIVSLEDAGMMSLGNAKNINEQLGEGWRLPTLEELTLLQQVLDQEADNSTSLKNGRYYWSSSDLDNEKGTLLRFGEPNISYHYNINVGNQEFRIRAVKDFKR